MPPRTRSLPRRSAAVKAPAIKRESTGTFTGVPHAHGCVTCHARYEDTCGNSNAGGECGPCRGYLPWSLLIANRLPKDCCRVDSRPATKEEHDKYRLSPACDWFRCTACARTHPFHNPTEVQP
jgi:hypothetical protein